METMNIALPESMFANGFVRIEKRKLSVRLNKTIAP
jgi:hypothetical protein